MAQVIRRRVGMYILDNSLPTLIVRKKLEQI